MKIQVIVQQKAGISYHRFINPLSYMKWPAGTTAEIIWVGDDEKNINCDILMYNKYCATSVNALKDMKKAGMKTVVDMDDLWILPKNHPNYDAWERNRHSERIVEHLKIADLVICTSMLLQDKVREINKNTVVIPNAFPYGQEMYKPQPVPHSKMTFMYMGGSTHYPDVKLLEGKFRRIGSIPHIKNNAEFVLAGYEKAQAKRFLTQMDKDADNEHFQMIDIRGDYDKMATVFSHTGSHRVLPSVNLDEYINYYDQADVALVPLVSSEWNSMKSTLKIAEAGCKALPVICSRVQPYWPELQDAPGILWVDDKKNWLDHIRWCVDNPVQVIDMGRQLAEYCDKHYNLITWNQVRKQVIESL